MRASVIRRRRARFRRAARAMAGPRRDGGELVRAMHLMVVAAAARGNRPRGLADLKAILGVWAGF
jgi:hypothetical protein